MNILKNTIYSDLIKTLLIQEFGNKEIKIQPNSTVFGQKTQMVYSHFTREFTILYKNFEVDIVVAEDNSRFLMVKTRIALDKQNPNNPYSYFSLAAPNGFYLPLINFFDKLNGRKKLIDFKYIPEQFQKSYASGDTFVFSETHLWENDENVAQQIVKDLYRQRFDSFSSGPFFEPKYNEQYNSDKIKKMLEDLSRSNIREMSM